MTWKGVVENGVVKVPPDWKDGTPVIVEAIPSKEGMNDLTRKAIQLCEKVSGLLTTGNCSSGSC